VSALQSAEDEESRKLEGLQHGMCKLLFWLCRSC
jgi:hypothetical protein